MAQKGGNEPHPGETGSARRRGVREFVSSARRDVTQGWTKAEPAAQLRLQLALLSGHSSGPPFPAPRRNGIGCSRTRIARYGVGLRVHMPAPFRTPAHSAHCPGPRPGPRARASRLPPRAPRPAGVERCAALRVRVDRQGPTGTNRWPIRNEPGRRLHMNRLYSAPARGARGQSTSEWRRGDSR